MKKINYFVVAILLLLVGCGSRDTASLTGNDSIVIDTALQARVDSIRHAYPEMKLHIMVMDSNGNVVACSPGVDDKKVFEPGVLFFPILAATAGEIDTSVKLAVGTKDFYGFRISDSHRLFGTDSVTLQQALEYRSPVAMADFGSLFYYNYREGLLHKIHKLMPGTKLPDLSNDTTFFRVCMGHDFGVTMRRLLECYRQPQIAQFVPNGQLKASCFTVENKNKMELCVKYSDDGRYIGMVMVENEGTNDDLSLEVMDSLFGN